jgi:hypothetical protein
MVFFILLLPELKREIVLMGITIVVFSIIYAFVGNNLYDFNSLPRAIQSIFIIFLACYLFYKMAVDGDGRNVHNDPILYLNGGILLYFMSSFIIFSFMRASSDQTLLLSMYLGHAVMNALCNILYAYGLIWISPQPSSTQL